MKKSSSLPGRKPSRLRCMKLEQRILFDGAAAADAVAADAAASVPLESALPAETPAPEPVVEAPVPETAAAADPEVVAEPTVAPGEASAAEESLAEPVADSASDSQEADASPVADSTADATEETDAIAEDTATAGQNDADSADTTDQTEPVASDANLPAEDPLESSDTAASSPLVETTSAESVALLDNTVVTDLDTDLAAVDDSDEIDGDLTALASEDMAEAPEIPVTEAQTAIRNYLAAIDLDTLFTLFNGDQAEPTAEWLERAETVRESWLAGDEQVPVELLDDATMIGALGAFAARGPSGTPVIYLNQDWMTNVADTPEVVSVLVEEFGHSIDHALNPDGDTAGDEGQQFAAAVLPDLVGESLFAQDVATLLIDGQPISVELATYTFTAAYQVLTDRTPAGKEANTHDFDSDVRFTEITITDGQDGQRYFGGNDLYATDVTINGKDYYGWISRPIKDQGVVKGFYFWTDADFTSLEDAQADGNQDGDGNVADNSGFVLVIDQTYFDSLPFIDGTIKNVGSSSDPVDNLLNAQILPEIKLAATADTAVAIEDGSAVSGNLLTNDIGDAAKSVTGVGTFSANQPVTTGTTQVLGQYGTLEVGLDGSYTYTVDNTLAAVQALRNADSTLNDAFTYTVTDANGLQASATLTVTVQGANDAPTAVDDFNTAKESLLSDGTEYTADDPLGSQAIGNVLDNETDVDQYGEEKEILGIEVTGEATGSTISTTTVYFPTLSNAVKTDEYVFIKNSEGVFIPPTTDGSPISITRTGNSITLSGSVDYTKLVSGVVLGFTNDISGTTNVKEATISSSTAVGTNTINLSPVDIDGSIAVGMTVSGTNLSTPPKVTAVNYDAVGKIVSVTVDQTVLFTNADLSFSSSANAGTELTGQYGSLVLYGKGEYVYKPFPDNPALAAGQVVTEKFTYTMQDGAGAQDTAILTITVLGSGANDPNAVADTAIAVEVGGSTLIPTPGINPSGNLLTDSLTGDTTPSGSLTVVSARATDTSRDDEATVTTKTPITGQYGILTLSSDGDYSYALDNNMAAVQALNSGDHLTETFLYTISNGSGQDSATLTITINGANDTPDVADVTATAVEAGGANNAVPGYNPSGNVLDTVSDVDDTRAELLVTAVRTGEVEGAGTPGTVGEALVGQYGSLTLAADGAWTYTVDNTNPLVNVLTANETLEEHFNFTVTDRSGDVPTGLTDMGLLTVTITGATDAVAVNSVFVNEGPADTSSNYAVFTVSGDRNTAVALALSDTEGLSSYIDPIDGSTKYLDARATLGVDVDTQLEVYNGTNWVAYDGANLPVMPADGKILVRVAVNPDDVHEGNESFTLVATSNGFTSIGKATINDEGEGDVYLAGNTTGLPDSVGTDDDRPTISISGPTMATVEGDMAVFTVSLDKTSTQNISFTPILTDGTATVGTDTGSAAEIEVSIDSGTSWSTVSGPVVIAAGQSMVLLRVATTNDGFAEEDETFVLETGYVSGTVTNQLGATATATITENKPPVAVDDTASTDEDTAISGNVLANDTDIDGDTLTAALVAGPAHGTLTLNTDGSFTYTPDADWYGQDTFTYTANDGTADSATATVTLTVAAVNDAPVAVDDAATASEDTPATITVLANDTDVDGDTLTVTAASAANGSVTINGDGTLAYTPDANFNGTDTITYTVSDGQGGTTTATVTVTVNPVDDPTAAPVQPAPAMPAGSDSVQSAPAELPTNPAVVVEMTQPTDPPPALWHLSSPPFWVAHTPGPLSSFDVAEQQGFAPRLFILPTLERLRQESGFGTESGRPGDGFDHLALVLDTSLHILPEAHSIAREAEQIREQADRMVPNAFTGSTLDSDLLDPLTAEEALDDPIDEATDSGNHPAAAPAESGAAQPVARIPFAAQLRQAANDRMALLSGRFSV